MFVRPRRTIKPGLGGAEMRTLPFFKPLVAILAVWLGFLFYATQTLPAITLPVYSGPQVMEPTVAVAHTFNPASGEIEIKDRGEIKLFFRYGTDEDGKCTVAGGFHSPGVLYVMPIRPPKDGPCSQKFIRDVWDEFVAAIQDKIRKAQAGSPEVLNVIEQAIKLASW